MSAVSEEGRIDDQRKRTPPRGREEVDAPSRRADDLGERLLRQPRHDTLRRAVLGSVPRQEQERSCQPLFNRVEEMIDEILFDTNVPLEHVLQELLARLRADRRAGQMGYSRRRTEGRP